MSIVFGLLLSFVLAGRGMAANSSGEAQESRIQQAIRALYQMQYERSSVLFQSAAANTPFHPMAPLGAIASHWLHMQSVHGYERGNQDLLENLGPTLTVYEKQMLQNPGETDIGFYYGAVMGLRARLQLFQKDWLGVILSGYRGIRHIQKARRQHPEQVDMMLPAALMNYYIGASAPYMKIASWMLRESGDKEEGLRQMAYVAEHGNYAKYEARSLLAFVYLYMEGDFDQAIRYANWMKDEFPENPYYHFLLADAYLMQQKLDSARLNVQAILSLLPQLEGFLYEEYSIKLQLLEGTLAFYEKEYLTAQQILGLVIENYFLESDLHFAYALLRMGNVLDLLGKREEALHYYRRAAALDNRSIACRLSWNFLEKPFRFEE